MDAGSDRANSAVKPDIGSGRRVAVAPAGSSGGRTLEARQAIASRLDASWAEVPEGLVRTDEEVILLLPPDLSPLQVPGAGLSSDDLVAVASGAALALARAHAVGVIHGSLAVASLMRNSKGCVRLAGFATRSDAERNQAASDAILGMEPGVAPEMLRSPAWLPDARTDLYALGAVLYQLSTGRPPFLPANIADWRHQVLAMQPVSPDTLREDLPEEFIRLILRLMEKEPADRPQHASTVHADLAAMASGRDLPTRGYAGAPLLDAARLTSRTASIGRTAEQAVMRGALDRVAETGEFEFVLVQGPAGIGKSRLVEDLQSASGAGVTWLYGKSDLLSQHVPYAPIASAVQSAVRRLLAGDGSRLARVSTRLADVLGDDAWSVRQIVPDLRLLVAERGTSPNLSSDGLARRLPIALRRTLLALMDDTPLVIFIDDLQWADTPTLELLEALANDRPSDLLLIGSARAASRGDDSIGLAARWRDLGPRLTEVALAPLDPGEVADYVALAFAAPVAAVRDLADVLHARSGGNPFFLGQLMRNLASDDALRYDPSRSAWTWKEDGAPSVVPRESDVLALLASRIRELPRTSQNLLSLCACVGRRSPKPLLARLTDKASDGVAPATAPLVEAGLLSDSPTHLLMTHDRVLEAAYRIVAPEERKATHRRIALAMIEEMGEAQEDEAVFAAAIQIERSQSSELGDDARSLFAGVLAAAAQAARRAAAVDQGLRYARLATDLLVEDWWERRPPLARRIQRTMAELLLAAAATDEAQGAIAELLSRSVDPIHRASAHRLDATLSTLRSDYEGAITAALTGLDELGIRLRRGADESDVKAAYDAVRTAMAGRSIVELSDLPTMTDPTVTAAMGLLATLISSIFQEDNLRFLHMAKMVELTCLHGVVPESAYGLAWFGVMAAYTFDSYEEGFAFAQAASALVDKRDYKAQRTAALVAVDQVSAWTQPMAFSIGRIREAIQAGMDADDVGMAIYARNHLVSDLIVGGAPISEIMAEAAAGLRLARQFRFRDIEMLLEAQLDFATMLTDGTTFSAHGRTEWSAVDEKEIVSRSTLFWVRFYAGMRMFFLGGFAQAVEAFDGALPLLWSIPAHVDGAYCVFFAGLANAQTAVTEESRSRAVARLTSWRPRIERWAELNPQTFRNKLLLFDAELSRLRGEDLAAMVGYENAAAAALEQGLLHEHGVTIEIASRHSERLGLLGIAGQQRQVAGASFRRWGADAKADALYRAPDIEKSHAAVALLDQQLDLDLVARASQALSEEILLENVVERLMTSMIVHAGADHARLLLVRDGVAQPYATAAVNDGVVVVGDDDRGSEPPAPVVNTVLRTLRPLVLNDAQNDHDGLYGDEFNSSGARSVLCLPLVKRGVLVAVLYLENRLACGIFSGSRTAALELLAAQAAISLETARLYAELLEETRHRSQSEAALRAARVELAQTSHLTVLGGLAASIAHEINQPLAGISSYAAASRRWLNRPQPDIEQALIGLENISEGSARAAEIIRALRALAKQVPTKLEPVAIDTVVRSVLDLIAAEIEARRIALHVDLLAGDAIVLGDATQLQQVVLNLLSNAMDAVDAIPATEGRPRTVTVNTTAEADGVLVSISDTGVGISADVLPRLFDPLMTTKASGMGMGLAICRSIVLAHGGEILAANAAVGAAISFRLPLPDR